MAVARPTTHREGASLSHIEAEDHHRQARAEAEHGADYAGIHAHVEHQADGGEHQGPATIGVRLEHAVLRRAEERARDGENDERQRVFVVYRDYGRQDHDALHDEARPRSGAQDLERDRDDPPLVATRRKPEEQQARPAEADGAQKR